MVTLHRTWHVTRKILFPGIEATVTANDGSLTYTEAFRLDQTGLNPGDVTKGMARPWQAATTNRSESDPVAELLYTDGTADADRAIIDAVGEIASARGVSRATIAMAWLHHHPVVAAPIVGAHTTGQIDDAVASLDIELTDDEIQRLEGPYTARCDLQGINDDQAGLQRARVQ